MVAAAARRDRARVRALGRLWRGGAFGVCRPEGNGAVGGKASRFLDEYGCARRLTLLG
jgi:hypothetical protein